VVDPDPMPRIPPGLQVERHDSLYLLLHPNAPRWTAVNSTGLAVARLCDGRHTRDEIASAAAGQWGQPVEAVRPDVEACLADLARAGFLESAQPAVPAPAVAGGTETQPRRGWRLHFYTTGQCNLRCRHCAVMNGAAPPDRLGTAAALDLIDQAAAAGAEGVAFGGGEPLLRPDLAELVGRAAGRMQTIVATNGTLVDDAVAAALAAAGSIVQVSLDGPTAAEHDAVRGRGAFERAWRGIERLQQAGVTDHRLALNVTLMRPNVEKAPEIVALARERGVPGVRFIPVQRMGRAAEGWAELVPTRDQYAAAYRYLYGYRAPDGPVVGPLFLGLELDPPAEGMWCGLGRMLVVDAAGDIYPCGLFMAPQFRLGNAAETPLAEALASEKLGELIAQVARRRDEVEDCRACAWRHFCQGGCAASVLLERGTWNTTDGACDLRRELFRELVFGQVKARQELGPAAGCAAV
jgi:mycofactocin biosynthetic radical S-adenosylmethionine protein MftC